MNVREFLKANSLKQVTLARYLGITEAAISNVVKEKSEFSKENLIKIVENPYGWDTSMLVDQPQPEENTIDAEQVALSNSLLEYLQRKVAELESKVERLTDEKAELLQENAILRYENRLMSPRKGDVEDVVNSSSASAV